MLPSKLTHRAAQRATASTPSTAACYACLAQTKQRTQHQRRHSSSKASSSSSADRDNNKPAGPAAKAATPSAVESEQPASARPDTRTSPQRNTKTRARVSRRTGSSSGQDGSGLKKAALPAAEPEEHFTKLPSVPSVQSLSESGTAPLIPPS